MRISDWSSDVCSSDLLLPAAVPSGAGERRLVGQGLHRMDQRHPCRPAVRRSRAAAAAGRSPLLRPSRPRNPCRAGGVGAALRHHGVPPLLLLVRRPPPPSPPPPPHASRPAPGPSRLPVLESGAAPWGKRVCRQVR